MGLSGEGGRKGERRKKCFCDYASVYLTNVNSWYKMW